MIERCKPGDVVYFVKQNGIKKEVNFGIVCEECYQYGVYVNTVAFRDKRMIEGVKYKDFFTPSEWRKLPKGWGYDTKLFEIEFEKLNEDVLDYSDRKPEKILEALEKGLFEYVKDQDQSYPSSEVDKGKWRIVRNHDPYWKKPDHYSLGHHEIYKTYEEAEQVVKDYEAECKRVAELSDYDYAVEEMDKTLEKVIVVHGDARKSYIEKCRKFLLEQKNFEDIVVRYYLGNIEWKYDRNIRWVAIPE